MKTLTELYKCHSGKVSDKWSLYLREYDRLFQPYRDKPISMLEIGVQNGGSLEIWGKYFPNAQKFVGCDINPECGKLTYSDPRIVVIVGDATLEETQALVFQQSQTFDLIIEDGSHTSGDIIKAFAKYFPALREGGLFVAEDLHCSYWQEFEGGLYDPYASISFFKALADIVNHQHWGVARTRNDLIAGFNEKYAIDIQEELLSEIHSIEFINSICVVRKFDSKLNVLGRRVVSGHEELVVSGLLDKHSSDLASLACAAVEQTDNYWSALVCSPAESHKQLSKEVQSLQVEAESLRHLLQAMEGSRSWRSTAPLRKLGSAARPFVRLVKQTKRAAHEVGGYRNLLKKGAEIAHREGVREFINKAHSMSQVRSMLKTTTGEFVDRNDYQTWIKLFDTPNEEDIMRFRQEILRFEYKPKISIVMPVYNPPLKFLIEAIDSVLNQVYDNWELCIADDASTDKAIRPLLESYSTKDERIKVMFRPENGHISAASNSALELATGEFVALLDNDDLLREHALYHVAKAALENPDAALIYSDEDKINQSGVRYDPYFKCELNYELLLAHNMITHLGVYKREILQKIGGFRLGFEGAQDYDLVLRVLEQVSDKQVIHIPKVLYHWRAIPGSTALGPGEKDYAAEAARKAIGEHLQRTGRGGTVGPSPDAPGMHRVRYALPTSLPLVSIIIPTRDHADILGVCLESLLTKTTYNNYEIIVVDNGSVEAETFKLLDAQPNDRVTVIRDDAPFNYSRLNNLAAGYAKGELICLMNNDIEILTPDWLEEMVSFACQPDIGCVGARLWYPDGRLQHGGVILGLGGGAAHSHKYLDNNAVGYFCRAVLHQSFSAVTAACLLIRRSIWDQVNGLDELFAVGYNDVDFCLRVREAGCRNVWTPYAEMIHHESISRGYENTPEKKARFKKETQRLQERWGDKLENDPAYSPNLTLDYEDFSLSWKKIEGGR